MKIQLFRRLCLSLVLLFGCSFIATEASQCKLPPFEENGSEQKCDKTAVCCSGFVCQDSTCVADYSASKVHSPSDFALTSHAVLNQLNSLSNGVFSALESASEAVSVSSNHLNLVNYDQVSGGQSNPKDLDKEFQEKMQKFWKRLNSTLKEGAENFDEFQKKTNTDFKDFKEDVKEKYKKSKKDANSSTSSQPFDYQQFIPGSVSGSMSNSSSFDWQQFVPKNINTDKNDTSSEKAKSKDSKFDKDLEVSVGTSSNMQSTGFDWSVYVPANSSPSSSQTSNSASGSSTGNFDWAQFVPQQKPGNKKSTNDASKSRSLRHLDEDKSNKSDGSFDYSQYIPAQSSGGGKTAPGGNQNKDLFAQHLLSNYNALTALYEIDNSNPDLDDDESMKKQIDDLKKLIGSNSKDVAKNAQMVADQVSKIADRLAEKMKVSAANLKEAAKELQEKSERTERDTKAVPEKPVKPQDSESIGQYIALALGIALLGFGLIAFCNSKQSGYSSIE